MWRTLLLSLAPGAAHIQTGKPGRGIMFFFLFLFFLNGYLVSPFLTSSTGIKTVALILTGVIWFVALLDAIRLWQKPRSLLLAEEGKNASSEKIYERTS